MSSFHTKTSRGEDKLDSLGKLVDTLLESSEGRFKLGKISFKCSDTEREGIGIFANEHLSIGDVLVAVPFQYCISVEQIMSHPEMRVILEEQPQLLNYPDEVLAMGLMYGATIGSSACPWAGHVASLPGPESFNTTIYWSEAELGELKGCTVFHLTQMMKRQIDTDWQSLHLPLAEAYPHVLGESSRELYMWALSIVYSRAVGLSRRGSWIRVVPPVLDMANHGDLSAEAFVRETFEFDEKSDMLRLINVTEKSAGEECFAVYGSYPNAKLAFTYGFVIHGCPHRAVDLWTRLQPTTYAAEQKQSILLAHPLTAVQTYDFTGTLRDGGSISAALLAYVRVIQATEEEIQDVENAFVGTMISVRNEAATYTSLRNLLQVRLQAEVAEADKLALGEMLLDNTPICNRKLMALIIRVDERDLVSEALIRIQGWQASLEDLQEMYVPPDASLPISAAAAFADA